MGKLKIIYLFFLQRKFLISFLFILIICSFFLFFKTGSQKEKTVSTLNTQENPAPTYNYHLHISTEPLRNPFSAQHELRQEQAQMPTANFPNIAAQNTDAPDVTVQKGESKPVQAKPAAFHEPPKLTGILVNNNYSAIIVCDNKYYKVTAGSYFASYQVISIDDSSITFQSDDGQTYTSHLKGF